MDLDLTIRLGDPHVPPELLGWLSARLGSPLTSGDEAVRVVSPLAAYFRSSEVGTSRATGCGMPTPSRADTEALVRRVASSWVARYELDRAVLAAAEFREGELCRFEEVPMVKLVGSERSPP
jgi:hypothetical protein